MLIQRYDLNKNKSMNNIKIILIMLKYKYIPSNSHGYTYSLFRDTLCVLKSIKIFFGFIA